MAVLGPSATADSPAPQAKSSWLGPLSDLTFSDWAALLGPALATVPIHTGRGVKSRTWYPLLPLQALPGVLQGVESRKARQAMGGQVRKAAPGPIGELAATGMESGQQVPGAVYDAITSQTWGKTKQAMLGTLDKDFPQRQTLEAFAADPNVDPKLLENRIDWLRAFTAKDSDAQQRLDLQARALASREQQGQQRINQAQQGLELRAGRNQLISDEDAQFRAQQAMRGDYMGAFAGLGYGGSRSANSQKVHDALRAQGYTGGDIVTNRAQLEASRAELKNLQVYRGRVNVALDTLDKNIKVALPYIERGVAGEYPVTNKLLNAIRTRTGDPTLTRFENAIYTIAIEYGRAMSGAASNGMLPEGARTDAAELLNSNMNKEQVKAALDLMVQHTKATQGAIGGALDQVRGEIGGIGAGKQLSAETPAPARAAPGGGEQVIEWDQLK